MISMMEHGPINVVHGEVFWRGNITIKASYSDAYTITKLSFVVEGSATKALLT
jgi:hypothetical protein